jgi:glycosyltransferase 2 family protein
MGSPFVKRLLTLAAALVILVAIYRQVNFREVIAILTGSDPARMALAIGLLIPLVLLAGMRLCLMVPRAAPLGLGEAIRLNLAAAVLNLVLPSKMGDLAKSWFFRQRGHLPGSLALALVIFERTCDMLSLLLWCAVGLAFVPAKDPLLTLLSWAVFGGIVAGVLVLSVRRIAFAVFALLEKVTPGSWRDKLGGLRGGWSAMHQYFWSDRPRLAGIVFYSLAIWFVNLFGAWVFLKALRVDVPVLDTLGLVPLAILVGLLPLTSAGVGTRDAALIYLFSHYVTPETAAALGLLLTLRFVLLALAGLPFAGALTRRS